MFKRRIKRINKNKIISIDEVSFDTHLSPNIGWSYKGTRIEKVDNCAKKRYTVISAVSNTKIIHNHFVSSYFIRPQQEEAYFVRFPL